MVPKDARASTVGSTSRVSHLEEPTSESISRLIGELFMDDERVDVVGEIEALQSIYGEACVLVHLDGSSSPRSGSATVQYDLITGLDPPYEEVTIRVCVSAPKSYPSTSAPSLQLLSRYIGSFGVDSDLFGAVTRTFMSSTGVTWSPGEVVVFDGVEKVRSLATSWYQSRLSEAQVGKLVREDETERRFQVINTPPVTSLGSETYSPTQADPALPAPPSAVEITEGSPIHDRGSAFVGRVCHIDHPSQVPQILDQLRSDRRIARASHPTINAWRCEVNGVVHQDNDDDGESAAGSRLAHLIQILELDHVLVIVTRYYGGTHLGPDRFKHINQCVRDALEQGGFLADDKVSRKGRKATKR